MKASLFRAELFRASRSRSTWILPLVGVVFLGLSLLGNVSVEHTKLVQGHTTPADASYFLIGLAFIMLLFSALGGVLLVTSEYRSRTMGLSVLVSPSRTPILVAKAKVSALIGALYGILAVGEAFALSAVAMSGRGDSFVVNARTFWLAVAIVPIVAVAGPWGTFVGTVVRPQLAAVIGTIVYVTMGEAAVLHYFPSVGRWLLGGAQAAVLADPSVPDRLGRLAGSGLLIGWIIATAAVAMPLFRNQEL
jgi:ABC-2 type transport system permease protein